ncbi:MAG: prefoldin subunit beta [Nitrososphaeria archaeon]|nr:prefoldin subunit beta [Aigarchaeota archaeon]MCX8187091.1 prefoldin subunit beta [Nitrososphaeria archaeon]MDW8021372.1 prefoldin subunit beta [Nitrososphaerota archaeon]
MSADEGEIPPSVRQQLARYQQLQQTLSVILVERQRLEAELLEVKDALEELQKSPDDATVYKAVGPILVQSSKQKLIEELTERRDLAETRLKLLEKQEQRTREQLENLQKELRNMLSRQPPT